MLSRHEIVDNNIKNTVNAEMYAFTSNEQEELFPLDLPRIAKEQVREESKNKELKKLFLTKQKDFGKKTVGDITLTTYMNKIYIPQNIRPRIMNWYHHFLCHPGASRLQLTIAQNLYWPGMVGDCVYQTRTCDTCQRYKKQKFKYGHVPDK